MSAGGTTGASGFVAGFNPTFPREPAELALLGTGLTRELKSAGATRHFGRLAFWPDDFLAGHDCVDQCRVSQLGQSGDCMCVT